MAVIRWNDGHIAAGGLLGRQGTGPWYAWKPSIFPHLDHVMIKERFFFLSFFSFFRPHVKKMREKKNAAIPFACGSAMCFEMSMFFSSEQIK